MIQHIISSIILVMISLLPKICMAELEYVGSFGGEIRGSAAYKNFVFLSQRNSIFAFDIHDKKNIRKVGTFNGGKRDIGRLAIKWPVVFYVWSLPGSVWDNLEAVDVSDPEHIHNLDADNLPSSKGELEWIIKGDKLFAKSSERDTSIYDVSNPLKPIRLGDKEREAEGYGNTDTDIEVHTPALDQSLIVPMGINFSGTIADVKTVNNLAYITDEGNNLKAVDVSIPQMPRYLGEAGISDAVKARIAKKKTVRFTDRLTIGNYEIRANTSGADSEVNGLISYMDVSNPASPKIADILLTTETSTLENVDQCWVEEGLLFVYISHRTSGGAFGKLAVISLRDASKPRYIGLYERFGEVPGGVSVQGDMIYVANHKNGLIILRINETGNEKYE